MNLDQFFRSWLIGFLFCLGLSLGSLALLMLQHLSGGQWGLVGRRVFEAASRERCRSSRCSSSRCCSGCRGSSRGRGRRRSEPTPSSR